MNSPVLVADRRCRFANTAWLTLITGALAALVTLSRGAERDTPVVPGMIPVGGMIPYAGAIDDESLYPGWLPCDGRELTVANYPELHRAIGTAWGGETDAGTFRLPDLRGRFLRGVDDREPTMAIDPDAAFRTASAPGGNTGSRVGTVQEAATGPHYHALAGVADATGPGFNAELVRFHALKIPDESAPVLTNGWAVQPIGPGETRPVNAAVHWLIRAK